MSTQITHRELTRTSVPEAVIEQMAADPTPEPEHQLSVARGIANAVLIATPFWALFAVALYFLI